MTVQIFIPFIILTFCYGKIVWVLTRRINNDLMKPKSAMGKSENCSDPSIYDKTATDTTKDKFELARKNT